MNECSSYPFFYCSPIFDLSLKMGVGFLSTHYSDLSFLLLVEAEVFYVPLLSGVQKPYRLLDWSPVQPTVTCHDSNRIILCLFVSMAGRYRWCCQEAAYTIRHSVMQSLHFSSPVRLPLQLCPAIFCPMFPVWPSPWKKVTLILGLSCIDCTKKLEFLTGVGALSPRHVLSLGLSFLYPNSCFRVGKYFT